MTKEIKFFCDICGKEFPPKEYSFLNGQITKIDKDLNPQSIVFEGHYCGECTHKVLEEITKLRNAKNNDTLSVVKQADQGTADIGT